MILFLGDSFTWGQGLHYYYMIENHGWTWDDCREYLKTVNHFERLGFEADEFRRTNNFSYLVGKYFNQPVITPRFENGGDNFEIYKTIQNLELFVSNTNIDYVIIQFSAPGRSLTQGGDENPYETVERFIEYEVDRIAQELNHKNLKWFGISWFPEHAKVMKEKYKDNFIPILYKGNEFDCFEFQSEHLPMRDLTIQFTQNIDDGHFNLEGHQILAESIINKINSL
jgi:lysophospholipase L1-like esterase